MLVRGGDVHHIDLWTGAQRVGIGEGQSAEVLLKAVEVLAVKIRGGGDVDVWVTAHGRQHHGAGAAKTKDAHAQNVRQDPASASDRRP
jgi:hypothetical protein